MDWSKFWELFNDNLPIIVTSIITFFTSFVGVFIAFFNTRKKKIESAVNSSVISKEFNIRLQDYYFFDSVGKKIYLSDVKLFKEVKSDEKENATKIG